jgi:hypothetical protein
MKRVSIVCVLPLCAATLLAQGPAGRGFGPREFGGFSGRAGLMGAGPGMRTPVTGAPYSATETLSTQQTLANGNQITRTQTSTVARDSQGRISTSETFTPAASTGKAPYTIQTIFDPVAGFRYELNSSTMIAIRTPLPKARPAGDAAKPRALENRPNVTSATLGTSVINGVSATGTQITETIPAGAIGNAQPIQTVRATWISSELKVPAQIKSSDPRFGTSDMELTNIVQAEPNASLFVVPSGYTIKEGGRGPGADGRRGSGSARRPAPTAQ